jgi:putative ABC transport system permease protein
MFKLTYKGLWAHKLRFALTGLAVVLGVAFMAGTMILTDTMGRTFDGLFDTANKGVDVVVRRASTVDAGFDGMDVRERVDTATLTRIKSIDGVDTAVGSITGVATLVAPDGKAAAAGGMGGTMGTNWVDDARLNPFAIATGHAPTKPDEVVLDQATVTKDGRKLGDKVTVLAKGAPRTLTLVGTATFGDADGIPGSTLVATTDATAQALFAEPGAYDSVVIASNGKQTPEVLSARVGAALGTERFETLTGAADTANNKADLKEGLGFFSTFLLAFAYISLFVGMFIIYNTFSIVVAQRSKEMAMLRAIGASRRQVVKSVLFESIAVGLVASAVGLGVGVLMSFGLRALLSAVGLDIPGGSVVITPKTVITAFLVGSIVTVLSALAPALRASKVKPIAALRDLAVDNSGASLRRTVIGMIITGAGVTAFAAGVVGSGSGALSMLGVGAVVTIVGVFVLGPVIARPVMGVLGMPITRLSGTTGRLAAENAKRSPKRTSATASALMIGVALVSFITILATSTKESVSATIGKSLQADYVIASDNMSGAGLSPTLGAEVAKLPQVAAVSPVRSTAVGVGTGSKQVVAVDTSTIGQLFDVQITAGEITDVTGPSVAIPAKKAAEGGPGLGDKVSMTFTRTGPVELTVRALYDGTLPTGDTDGYLIGIDTYQANVTDQFDDQLFVKVRDGISPAQASAALETALVAWPNADLQDQTAFKDSITGEIDMILNLIYGLLALAVVIALIGIANTLALSVHERRRELGLLRAVGMTRPQVRSSIRWESVMIALFGTALGFLLALAGSWGIVKAISKNEVMSLSVPPVQMIVIVTLAAIAGVVAAVGPARRAAKLDILAAIASH